MVEVEGLVSWRKWAGVVFKKCVAHADLECRGRALKHVEPQHEHGVVFHKDGAHPSVEVGL